MNIILLAVILLLVIAFISVWWTPKSCRYVADILLRRARAYEACIKAYNRAWHEGEQLTLDGVSYATAGTAKYTVRNNVYYKPECRHGEKVGLCSQCNED